jgi:hypothetical protein
VLYQTFRDAGCSDAAIHQWITPHPRTGNSWAMYAVSSSPSALHAVTKFFIANERILPFGAMAPVHSSLGVLDCGARPAELRCPIDPDNMGEPQSERVRPA